uniref:Uncharacterized protein n=1 Tax=Arundo donax TaxID=35708 RepID=A0A0A9A487_ARUDO
MKMVVYIYKELLIFWTNKIICFLTRLAA